MRRRGRLAPGRLLVALVALAALAAGCSSQGIERGPAGMPLDEGARVSLVVAQTRAQFPHLSGTDIPFDPRQPPAATGKPTLALQGQGVEVQPGLQTNAPQHVQAALYLARPGRTRGYLQLTRASGAAERLPIVAYDQRGDALKRFDFIYVLATPQGALRYLALIGGPYAQGGADYLGYEGTLIVPGPGNDLQHWSHAVQIDFGYHLPVEPPHEAKVKQAVTLFDQLQQDMAHLGRLRADIAETQAELATQRTRIPPGAQEPSPGPTGAAAGGAAAPGPTPQAANPPGGNPAGPSATGVTPVEQAQAAIARLNRQLTAQRSQRSALEDTTEATFVRYYGLRQAIATEYAAFTQSNRYLWLNADGRQAFYDRWKVVEFHHPRIDHMVDDFLTYRPRDAKVQQARATAMAVITKENNWAKDPSRAGQASPR